MADAGPLVHAYETVRQTPSPFLSHSSKWRIPMGAVLKQCAVSAAVAMLLLAGCLEKTKTPVIDDSKTARPPAGPPNP